MPEPDGIHLHDDPALFRESVNFTAVRTGFNARLVEKDYFCTVLLAHLIRLGGDRLVFKGGTCLAKVHAGFYRLSEDLDFAISLPVDASRTTRQHGVAEVKEAVADMADQVSVFTTVQPLRGANNSTQYNGAIGYDSPTTGQKETILVEVSVREPLLMPAGTAPAKTLLLDPLSGESAVQPLPVSCIALTEAMAEKFRAAMSRRDVAIRDFYDLHYMVEHLGLDACNAQLVDLVRRKLAVPGNLPIDLGKERLAALRRQRDARLKAVLRYREFQAFDLDRAVKLVAAMAVRLAQPE